MSTGETLHVLHVAGSLSRLGGGVSEAVWSLARWGSAAGCRATVVGTRDEHTAEDTSRYAGIPCIAGRMTGPRVLGFSAELAGRMADVGDVDIVHSHAMWPLTSVTARRFAERRSVPRLVSMHGMLEPWARRHRSWKKDIAAVLYQNRNIHTAQCLHATARQEARNLRARGLRNAVAVVGLGIDLEEFSTDRAGARIAEQWPELEGKRLVLFLSRIHPIKGLMHLAEAWGRLHGRHPGWRLVVTGGDEGGHRAEIERILAASGADRATTFTGPAYGRLKARLFAACELFVQPSMQENFGITIAEAMASARPVITTTGTPWTELEDHRCGWRVPVGTDPLHDVLDRAMSMPREELSAMGGRGLALVRDRYSWAAIAGRMADVYRWMTGRAGRPAFVYGPEDEIEP